QNNIHVQELEIVAILRDWSLMMSMRKEDYPDRQVVKIPVPRWPEMKTVGFIRDRIEAHEAGKFDPPLCTPEERWHKPDQWALMRKGRKTAIKLYNSFDEAMANAAGDSGKYVEERPGDDIRCKFYCPVKNFCDYGRLLQP